MNLLDEDVSVISWSLFQEEQVDGHHCGYCKSPNGQLSTGMWAYKLTVQDYQNLIDRGWRRSGKYCYKPVMDRICCPMYTIKCDAVNYQLSKSQKKVMKKFNKYLIDGVLGKNDGENDQCENIPEFSPLSTNSVDLGLVNCDETKLVDRQSGCDKIESMAGPSKEPVKALNEKCAESTKIGMGADPSKPICKKAKVLRAERRQAKLLQRGMSLDAKSIKTEPKTIEEFLNEDFGDKKHSLKLQLINLSNKRQWNKVKHTEFDLYKKYQIDVHNDPAEKCTFNRFENFLANSPLQITLTRLKRTHEHFNRSFALYRKYQKIIHDDDDSDVDSYLGFLVNSPLMWEPFSDGSDLGFGSYHQLYWLDDKLIAVGVIDILPKCVSAVYFFYDPDYRNLTLGTYGSCREVEFIRKLNSQVPSIQHYYMGFYIHSCVKMRYKGKLSPSFLLCPETYEWSPIEKCIPKLNLNKYSRFNDDLQAPISDSCQRQDYEEIKVVYRKSLIFAKQYARVCQESIESFERLGALVGRKCAKSIIFIVQ